MKRRDFIKRIPVAASIPFLLGDRRVSAMLRSPFAPALKSVQSGNDRVLVVVYLEGGNDGLNTLVPFEDPEYDLNRPSIGFTTAAEKSTLVFKPRANLGFNPQMNSLAPLWAEGKFAVLQNVGYANPCLSHFRSGEIWCSASDASISELSGWGARYLESVFPDYVASPPTNPMALSIGSYQSPMFFGPGGPMNIRTDDPRTFLDTAKQAMSQVPKTDGGTETLFVRSLMNVTDDYAARFSSLFPAAAVNKVPYPDSPIASDLSKVAWCIGAGMQTKIYFVHLGGFDTHYGQFSKDPTRAGHAQLLKQLSDALSAFQRDLEAMKQDERVVTMVYSEFGRRVSGIGPDDSGTDHGTAAPQFLIGTPVNGELYGNHPDLSNLDDGGNLTMQFEFRQLYASLLEDWLGADPTTVATLLHPQETAVPYDTNFPVNGKGTMQKLIVDGSNDASRQTASGRTLNAIVNPNPIRSRATLSFMLPAPGYVEADLFDASGRHVMSVTRAAMNAGPQSIAFDASAIPVGAYYLKLMAADTQETVLVNIMK